MCICMKYEQIIYRFTDLFPFLSMYICIYLFIDIYICMCILYYRYTLWLPMIHLSMIKLQNLTDFIF